MTIREIKEAISDIESFIDQQQMELINLRAMLILEQEKVSKDIIKRM